MPVGHAATWHGHERAPLDALRRPAPYVEGQIGALARINGLAVVTTNTKDFARFEATSGRELARGVAGRPVAVFPESSGFLGPSVVFSKYVAAPPLPGP